MLGLLCDLYGELGAVKGDGDGARLALSLALVEAEAARVEEALAAMESERALQRARRSAIAFNSSASSSESFRSKMTSASRSAGE